MRFRKIFHMHRAILTRDEKNHFFLLTALFFITSIFDIVGIGAIGYFLIIMMNPEIVRHIPIINILLPRSWSIQHTLILLGCLILFAFLIKTTLSCFVQKKLISYCFEVGARIRLQLMELYLYAPYSYFVGQHTSEITNRILGYASNYASLCLISFMTVLVHSVFIMAITSFLFVLHPIITLMLIVMFSFIFFVHTLLVRGRLYIAGQNVNTSASQMIKSVQESFLGIKEVRILSKEKYFINTMKTASKIFADSNGLIGVYQKLPLYFLESGMFIFIIILCISELSLDVKVQSIIALCGILVTAGLRLLPSLFQWVSAMVGMQSTEHTLEVIYDNLVHSKENFNHEAAWPKNMSMENKQFMHFENITFNDVSFRYPQMEIYALKSVNLTIKKGQSIGIIGTSGAGKSTLIDLLLGLLTPTHGQILLDGAPFSDRAAWVTKFAYIPQNIYLLDASIKQNIIFGELESFVDQPRLHKAIQMAQLENVISNLPRGVDTHIGENGIKLSGGQRQRIALARAFYHEREIIVMDEATAALDNETEHAVVESIKHLHQIKTLIIIAHRYTTIKHCDIIYRFHEGKLIDYGSYEEVIDIQNLHKYEDPNLVRIS